MGSYEYRISDGIYLRKAEFSPPEVLGPGGWTTYGGEYGYRDWFTSSAATAEEVNLEEERLARTGGGSGEVA